MLNSSAHNFLYITRVSLKTMNKHFFPADILLPKNNFEKWSCIACDQYTSEPKYWEETKGIVGDCCSAFKVILPEVYLSVDNSKEIDEINRNMRALIDNDKFNTYENTMVYTVRTLKCGKERHGLVGLIDLEDYSYKKGATTSIRATEATVIDRIPPRVKIRKDAILEIPHIMLLIDDPTDSVFASVKNSCEKLDVLYDFNLMQNAGHIKGYKLSDSLINDIQTSLDCLKNQSKDGMLFAVGDGNHSLATAKECFNQGFGPKYALVEVVNIHDSSLEFEPIYRVLFDVDPEKVIKKFKDWCADGDDYTQDFTCVFSEREITIKVKSKGALPIATLQGFLDDYLKNDSNAKLDYIHGIESTRELSKEANRLGFIFDGMEKSDLFMAVSKDGSLPRKTFSMGCADDKRFYLEARKIK